jgi:polyisoprenoid-binding protein YceI
MKTILLFLATSFIAVNMVSAQTVMQAQNPAQSFDIKGTSTLHDWKMKVTQVNGKMDITSENGNLQKINSVSILIPVSSLKSDEKTMNNKTYEALNNDKYPNIIFVSKEITLIPNGKENQWLFKASGNLTIAGTTKKNTVISGIVKKLSNNSLDVVSIVSLKMTEFNVTPPSMFLGTIKTGDVVYLNIDQSYK